MFLKRSYSPEIMDDFSIADDRIDQALAELKVINKFLGGNSLTRQGVKLLLKTNSESLPKVLDIGAGTSEVLLNGQINENQIFCVDINHRASYYAKKKFPEMNVICADAFSLPFKEASFDIVHASLFFHHFKEEQIAEILKTLLRYTKKGIIINDLRRSVFALTGIWLLTSLFSKSEMVKNDGPLSVRRGFVKSDIISLMNNLGIRSYSIKRKWAFRWLVIIFK